MTQDEINVMLAEALDDAQSRLEKQERCIDMLVDLVERQSFQIAGALKETETARLHYADQRRRLGLTIDLSGGSLIGGKFGLPDE